MFPSTGKISPLLPFLSFSETAKKKLMLKFYKQKQTFWPQQLVRKVQLSRSKSGKVKRKLKERPSIGNVKKCELWAALPMPPVRKKPQ